MGQIQVDDIDPSIAYSGSWQEIIGSTRQWGGGTVHSTTQNGASATITFSGTRIILYCTLLAGTGDEIVGINFDGQQTSSSQLSQSAAVYNDVWWDSGEVDDAEHTLIVSNGGGPSDTPLQVDRFAVVGVLLSPSIAAPIPTPTPASTPQSATTAIVTTSISTKFATVTAVASASSSSGRSSPSSSPSSNPNSSSVSVSSPASTSSSSLLSGSSGAFPSLTSTGAGGQQTVVSIQYITTTGADGSVTTEAVTSTANRSSSASSKAPIAAVAGGVIGGLLLILLLLLLLCLRRRRKAKQNSLLADDTEKLAPRPQNLTDVTPFQLNTNLNSIHSGTVVVSHETDFTPKYILSRESPVTGVSTASPVAAGAFSTSSAYGGSAYNGSASNSRSSTDKNPELLSDAHSSPTSMYASALGSPEHDNPPLRLPEVDAGPYRPRYLSGDTVIAGTSSSIYASTMLAPHDTNDIPPSYQSTRNHSPNPHPYPAIGSFLGQ